MYQIKDNVSYNLKYSTSEHMEVVLRPKRDKRLFSVARPRCRTRFVVTIWKGQNKMSPVRSQASAGASELTVMKCDVEDGIRLAPAPERLLHLM